MSYSGNTEKLEARASNLAEHLENEEKEEDKSDSLLLSRQDSKDNQLDKLLNEESFTHLKHVHHVRCYFAWMSYALVVCWLGIVLFLLIWSSIGSLSGGICGSLLGSCVGGFIGIILGYLYFYDDIKNDECRKQLFPDFRDILQTLCVGLFLGGIIGWVICWDCHYSLKLSETVIGILLGTTTLSVIGILHFVMKWLFPKLDNELKALRKSLQSSFRD